VVAAELFRFDGTVLEAEVRDVEGDAPEVVTATIGVPAEAPAVARACARGGRVRIAARADLWRTVWSEPLVVGEALEWSAVCADPPYLYVQAVRRR
jgi:hypothetical protein